MTFGAMLSAVYDDLGYGSSPSSDQVTRIKRWINEGYRHVMGQPGMELLRDGSVAVTTTANSADVIIPAAVNQIYNVTQVTNSLRLRLLTRDAYRAINPGLISTSNLADAYVPWGWSSVIAQPASTGVPLYAVSSSAADTTQTFAVVGVRANGDQAAPVTASTALNGTTRVQIGSVTDYAYIDTLNMSAAAVGVVTVYDAAASGNIVARYQPGQTAVQYLTLKFFPTPSAATAYTVDVQFQLQDLVGTTDVPMLPPDFHDLLPLYARMRDYQRAGDGVRYPVSLREWSQRVADLKFAVQFPKDYTPVSGNQLAGYGWNNLGPNFPADIRF